MDANSISILGIIITTFSTIVVVGLTLLSNRNVEKIKAQIDIQNSKQKLLFEDTKNSIHNFFTAYQLWLEEIDDVSKYKSRHLKKMDNIESFMEGLSRKAYHESKKVKLFISDVKLISSVEDLISLTNELQTLNIECINETYYDLDEQYKVDIIAQNSGISNYDEVMGLLDKKLEEKYLVYCPKYKSKLQMIQAEIDNFINLSKRIIN